MDDGRRPNRKEECAGDYPMYSRLFIVCEKGLNRDDFKNAFSVFGEIEDILMPCDNQGNPKGVVYIKFSKTSEAAHALEEMNYKVMQNTRRPLKVMVAANRSEVANEDLEKYRRLFLTVPKTLSENDLNEEFSTYGQITSVILQKDHNTGESKGFAYITYTKFSQAAHAYEECDKKYRAIFAKPKIQKQPETAFESRIDNLSRTMNQGFNPQHSLIPMMNMRVRHDSYTRITYICCPHLTQMYMERLFDLIPGMIRCKYYVDLVRNVGKGMVQYSNPTSAAYAVEKLNEFEYPPGMLLFVKPDGYNDSNSSNEFTQIPNAVQKLKNAIEYSSDCNAPDLAQLADAIAEASTLIKKATGNVTDENVPNVDDLNYCSVKLPKPQPLAHIDSVAVKRCFLICKPSPPPLNVLRDVFCRFGDLINVYTLPNKTIGYARYASAASADEAIRVLHGAEICGVRMKVLEADEETPPRKRERHD